MAHADNGSITLNAQCLCKANTFKTQIPKSKLPLTAYICHCTSCRRVNGGLYTSCLRWTGPLDSIDSSKLKSFAFSPNVDLLFCPTCSTPIFWVYPKEPEKFLGVLTGVLRNENENLIKFVEQMFLDDTIDGGASIWFRHPNQDGSEAKRFKLGAGEEVPQDWPDAAALTGYEAKKEDAVPVRCKCKGVDFVLHRDTLERKDGEEPPSRIDPKTGKFQADLCPCDSCRLQSGIDIFSWTFSDMRNISFNESNTDEKFPETSGRLKELVDAKIPAVGSLTYYNSSPGVYRFFCGTCSACVFYAADSRPKIVDIAVGLLDASDGARAEGLLSWSYGAEMDDRQDGDGGWRKELFDHVEKDGEDFRVGKGYPKNFKTLAKDAEVKARA